LTFFAGVSVDLVHPEIDRYLHALATDDDPVLAEMEQLARQESFPIVGPQVGRLLAQLTRLTGARRVLELGSGFGYSAYWFAHAVGSEGKVVMTDNSAQRSSQARTFLDRAGLGSRVESHTGDGLELVSRIEGPFDIVFNDVDKHLYPQALDAALTVLRPGGLFISDNMLWMGRVLEPDATDPDTLGVQELTRRLFESKEFQSTLIPIRDGVTLSVYGG
jgi:caffeoyl-CoA O-methyltransferase